MYIYTHIYSFNFKFINILLYFFDIKKGFILGEKKAQKKGFILIQRINIDKVIINIRCLNQLYYKI